jgi:hypothetical protein
MTALKSIPPKGDTVAENCRHHDIRLGILHGEVSTSQSPSSELANYV